MAIDRYQLVTRHNPILNNVDKASPLTVGNGEFAFTADVTGLQSLYREYAEAEFPLCTMSQWGWHTQPTEGREENYTLKDLVMTEYTCQGRKVYYPKNSFPGNEEVYHWLRHNPHRLNLGRVTFTLDGRELSEEELSHIRQELDLYTGILKSRFELEGCACYVETAVDSDSDTLLVRAESELLKEGRLSILLVFPYGSPEKSAADFHREDRHRTEILEWTGQVSAFGGHTLALRRTLDEDIYYVALWTDGDIRTDTKHHKVLLESAAGKLEAMIHFAAQRKEPAFLPGETDNMNSLDATRPAEIPSMSALFENCKRFWKTFWEEGGIIRLHNSPDPRAEELERREILSLYLMAVNSSGSMPPQETGLTCNSWYGKMHLEMYLWHCAWSPLWGRGYLLERSLPWYLEHLPAARENAERNGYKGARWPKMIAGEGIDSPSKVAPLLVWQQPHIIFMLELRYREKPDKEFLEKYWTVVKETADFMADFAVCNDETKVYELVSPLIPVQECHKPEITKNPAFEVAYWSYGLKLAVTWAKRLGRQYDSAWEQVGRNMAPPATADGVYLAHDNCPNTFTDFNIDHPSMLMAMGMLPGEGLDAGIMEKTLDKVLEVWKYPSLWGWDFAVMAMTATRLGQPQRALDILLKDTSKNEYTVSGNNRQRLRKDLPLYLPGNGSLLLAFPLMAEGFEGCGTKAPGFPKDWVVEAEGIHRYI